MTSHFLFVEGNGSQHSACDSAIICPLVQWARQAQALASRLGELSGERSSVHVFSPCFEPALADALSSTGDGAPVVVHANHARELQRPVEAMRQHALRSGCTGRSLTTHDPPGPDSCDWSRVNVFMILRWQIMSMADARLVVYLDLDVDVLPRWPLLLLLPEGRKQRSLNDTLVEQAARDWLLLLRCANRSRYSLFSYPDHSSPVNGALLIVKPDASLYREGVAVLRGALSWAPFNGSTGWQTVGRPSKVVPQTDHVWRRKHGHSSIVDGDTWDFVGGAVDQGFFFYMLRVRRPLGVDIRLSECAADSTHVPPTSYYHYGSEGGTKPYLVIARWASLLSKRRCYGKLWPHFVVGFGGRAVAYELQRTIAWTRRTSAEVEHTIKQLDGMQLDKRQRASHLLARSVLSRCSAVLDAGLACLAGHHRSIGEANITITTGKKKQTMPPEGEVVLATFLENTPFTRALPLLTPAEKIGFSSGYTRSSTPQQTTRG